MYRWIAIISLWLGCLALGVPNARLARFMSLTALSGVAITAWGLAGPTILSSPHRPHRVGAWVLRGFWGILILSIPFTHPWWTSIRMGCLLFGAPMLFGFIGRLHRLSGETRMAQLSDLTAVFGFCTLLASLLIPSMPQVPFVLALAGLALCASLVLWTLPTSVIQTSAEDHRT